MLKHKLACHRHAENMYMVTKTIRRRLDLKTHKVTSYALYSIKPANGMITVSLPWGDKKSMNVILSASDQKSALLAGKKILTEYK
jgi:hypothetical protein